MAWKYTVGSKVSNQGKLFLIKKEALIGEGNETYFCETEDKSEARWILENDLTLVELKVIK